MKKLFPFFTFFSFWPNFLLALEVNYPKLNLFGREYFIEKGISELTFAKTVFYFYLFLVILAGLFALVGLVKAGFRWLTSFGSPIKLTLAKEEVLAVFFGLILLFASFLIFNSLNPQLLILKPSAPRLPRYQPPEIEIKEGVFVEILNEEKPILVPWDLPSLEETDWKGKIQRFILKDSSKTKYSVILFEKPFFKGKCRFLTNGPESDDKNVANFQFDSLLIVPQSPQSIYQPGEKIVLFSEAYLEKPILEREGVEIGGERIIKKIADLPIPIVKSFAFEKGEGKYLALFTKETGFRGPCFAFSIDIDDLERPHPSINYSPEDLGGNPRSLILLQTKKPFK